MSPHQAMICCPHGRDGGCTMPLAPWHGKVTGYNNHRCGCDECRAAWATYMREGVGRASRDRYRAKLLAHGKMLSGSLAGPDRKGPYIPRGRS